MNINDPARTAAFLEQINVLPRRLWLDTPGVEATVPMLRGTWGAALHDLSPEAYQQVFGGEGTSDAPWRSSRSPAGDRSGPVTECQGNRTPGYLFRPAPPDPHVAPAVDFFLFGPAVEYDDACRRAWQEAARRGLGPRRRPFDIRGAFLLDPSGTLREERLAVGRSVGNAPRDVPEIAKGGRPAAGGTPRSAFPTEAQPRTPQPRAPNPLPPAWPLSRAVWPLEADAPCQLVFAAPLRLRRQGRLVDAPTLADLVVGACRRIEAFFPDMDREGWKDCAAAALETARTTPQSPWRGARLDLHRWSARQQNDLDLHGVSGTLDLPEGPGELAPLLAAARWLHIGKGTVMGLGQFEVGGRR